jgi:hypothetical protein
VDLAVELPGIVLDQLLAFQQILAYDTGRGLAFRAEIIKGSGHTFLILLRRFCGLDIVPPEACIAPYAENVCDGVHSGPGLCQYRLVYQAQKKGAYKSWRSSFLPSLTFVAECIKKPRPSRPENALLINSSWRAWMSVAKHA